MKRIGIFTIVAAGMARISSEDVEEAAVAPRIREILGGEPEFTELYEGIAAYTRAETLALVFDDAGVDVYRVHGMDLDNIHLFAPS